MKYNAFAITNAYNGHNEISYVNFNSGRRVLPNLKKNMYCPVCPMTRRSRQNYLEQIFAKIHTENLTIGLPGSNYIMVAVWLSIH